MICEESQAHKICEEAGFIYIQGIGYITRQSKCYECSKELSEAMNYLWDEFDCMFIWKEAE